MSSQSLNTVATFDRRHYLHALQTAIHHPTLILLLESILKNDAVFHSLLDKHIVSSKLGETTTYGVSYPFGAAGWSVVQSLSDLVFAAAHNITPYSNKGQRPLTIPESVFEELGIRTARDVAILNSREDLRMALIKFQQFLCRTILWLASHINHSVSKGFEACLNWGTFIGLKWDKFLFRVSPSTVIAEARKRSITAEEIHSFYETKDTSSLTRYIPHLPVHYPDIAARIHFPYHPEYPRSGFFDSLPCLIANYPDDDSSMTSTLVSPVVEANGDIKMKDQDIEDITDRMGNLTLD
ncbi:hypothetical protein IW261DRAFT_1578521 [Armillaria novae-zelandiae]|uniref:Uncharacterized protein n=1 Tax=Armillaria novae-zelandiae TaxID=153914 RepID=A0AA39N638_9AGAR|nr:hypothetical protein IW261DRAFT_1578521 [Armillaria novae-zelandiae]